MKWIPFEADGSRRVPLNELLEAVVAEVHAHQLANSAGQTSHGVEMFVGGGWKLNAPGFACEVVVLEESGALRLRASNASPGDIRPWQEVFRSAFARLSSHERHVWHARLAVIGRSEAPLGLLADTTAGWFRLTPSELDVEETSGWKSGGAWYSGHHRVNGKAAQIDVSSVAEGATWAAAQEVALIGLHRLQVALTLLFMRPVEVTFPPSQSEWVNSNRVTSAYPRIGIPAWVGSVLLSPEDGTSLDMALDSFWEAERTRSDHPSFSIVGYVSAIESAGKVFARRAGHETVSASAAFNRGLESIGMSAEDRTAFEERWYRMRSATAHAGKMHSLERFGGLLPLTQGSIFLTDDPRMLIARLWTELRPTAQRVLLAAVELS